MLILVCVCGYSAPLPEEMPKRLICSKCHKHYKYRQTESMEGICRELYLDEGLRIEWRNHQATNAA